MAQLIGTDCECNLCNELRMSYCHDCKSKTAKGDCFGIKHAFVVARIVMVVRRAGCNGNPHGGL